MGCTTGGDRETRHRKGFRHLGVAIEDEFVDRGMPRDMRRAYWRLHAGRRSQFHTGDSTVSFDLVRTGESPKALRSLLQYVYGAVTEGLLRKAEKSLLQNEKPTGLAIAAEHTAFEAEEYKRGTSNFKEGDLYALTCADETYALGRRVADTSYTSALICREDARAGQHLHAAKSQALGSEPVEEVQTWTDAEFDNYIHGREQQGTTAGEQGKPPHAAARAMIPRVSSTIILGSVVILQSPTDAPLHGRMKAVWGAHVKTRAQLKQRTVTVRARVHLLEATVLPTCCG